MKKCAYLLLAILWLAACRAEDFAFLPPAGEISATVTSVPSPTSTRVWFPPSATSVPLPTIPPQPTPDWLVGVGDIAIADDFSRAGRWETASSEQGSAVLEGSQLTLAVQPKMYLFSLQRELTLSDFYAEITARPSLCRGEDQYGILARASALAYYRFAIVCNGAVRAERVSGNQRVVLQPPVPSGDAPPGAPAEVRIGLWAARRELRFFLNGHYQFTIQDASLSGGTLGVFVRSSGDTPVTVSFSDMIVRRVSYISPTPNPTPTKTPIPTLPTLRK